MGRFKETRNDRVTVVMAGTLKDRVETLAEENERSVSDFIRIVLKEYCQAIDETIELEAEEA